MTENNYTENDEEEWFGLTREAIFSIFIMVAVTIILIVGLFIPSSVLPSAGALPAQVDMVDTPNSDPMTKSFNVNINDADKVELLVFDQKSDEYLGKKTITKDNQSVKIDEYDTSYYVVTRSVGIDKSHITDTFEVNNYQGYTTSSTDLNPEGDKFSVSVTRNKDTDIVKVLVFNTETKEYTQKETMDKAGIMDTNSLTEDEIVIVKSVNGDKSFLYGAGVAGQ